MEQSGLQERRRETNHFTGSFVRREGMRKKRGGNDGGKGKE